MLAAVVVLGALTGASYAVFAVWGQTARSDSASPGVVVTFSYSGELVENAAGGVLGINGPKPWVPSYSSAWAMGG